MLAPPTPMPFETKEELMKYLQTHTHNEGFAVFVRRSSRGRQVLVQCDRSGSYDDRNKTVSASSRETASRKIECPFSLYASVKRYGLWAFEVKNASHNHPALTDISVHPARRRLSSEALAEVSRLTAAGVSPKEIAAALRQADADSQHINRDIYNATLAISMRELDGRQSIEALLDTLVNEDYKYDYVLNDKHEVTQLFFARESAIQLSRRFSTVFVLDCTYKMNRFSLPLLHFVGMSPTNMSFSSCFAFLLKEAEGGYAWALCNFAGTLEGTGVPKVIATDKDRALMNAVQRVLPTSKNILCTWHINKNVTSNCKHYFETAPKWDTFLKIWSSLCSSQTELEYADTVKYLQSTIPTAMFEYLDATWLRVKEVFVCVWTGRSRHYGNATTSRAEGAHAVLKKYITASTGDLLATHKKIALAWENQIIHVNHAIEAERLRVGMAYRVPLFKNVAGKVSKHALNMARDQQRQFGRPAAEDMCTGSFSRTMGVPCSHMIRARQLSSKALELGF